MDGKRGDKMLSFSKSLDSFCKLKDCGGLGLRRFYDFNLALLSKLGWKVVSKEDVFWMAVLRAKYCRIEKF